MFFLSPFHCYFISFFHSYISLSLSLFLIPWFSIPLSFSLSFISHSLSFPFPLSFSQSKISLSISFSFSFSESYISLSFWSIISTWTLFPTPLSFQPLSLTNPSFFTTPLSFSLSINLFFFFSSSLSCQRFVLDLKPSWS